MVDKGNLKGTLEDTKETISKWVCLQDMVVDTTNLVRSNSISRLKGIGQTGKRARERRIKYNVKDD